MRSAANPPDEMYYEPEPEIQIRFKLNIIDQTKLNMFLNI